MTAIRFDSVTRVFPDGTIAVNGLSFGIEQGETMVLVGPSGCGKSTTLRLLAGLDRPTAGSVWLQGCDVTRVPPAKRNVAMMFQNDALYPHMSVRGNLSFGLKAKRGWLRAMFRPVSGSALNINQCVEDVALRLGIQKLLDRKPHELSGGERQRVALGRALVREPAAFLLDEPLSRLDARLADQLRLELMRTLKELKSPVLFVTHDQREAMAIADRILLMKEGRLVQIGKPLDIYQRPANLFAANFFGSVPLNVMAIPDDVTSPPGAVNLGFRAEHTRICGQRLDGAPDRGAGELRMQATVTGVERLGDHGMVFLRESKAGSLAMARCDAEANIRAGGSVQIAVDAAKQMWFDNEGNRLEPDDN